MTDFIFSAAESCLMTSVQAKRLRRSRRYYLKRNGGMWFWRMGHFGGSFYLSAK